MNDGGSAVVTPVKVYATNQNSFCRICNFDFTSAGKDGSHNLLNPRKNSFPSSLFLIFFIFFIFFINFSFNSKFFQNSKRYKSFFKILKNTLIQGSLKESRSLFKMR